jgi:hypothetical protein
MNKYILLHENSSLSWSYLSTKLSSFVKEYPSQDGTLPTTLPVGPALGSVCGTRWMDRELAQFWMELHHHQPLQGP